MNEASVREPEQTDRNPSHPFIASYEIAPSTKNVFSYFWFEHVWEIGPTKEGKGGRHSGESWAFILGISHDRFSEICGKGKTHFPHCRFLFLTKILFTTFPISVRKKRRRRSLLSLSLFLSGANGCQTQRHGSSARGKRKATDSVAG